MLTSRIPQDEYYGRWKRAQELCKAWGVEALVVWGKGGGVVDTANDLIYLANYSVSVCSRPSGGVVRSFSWCGDCA